MATRNGKLGVGIYGVGWAASQHIAAFQKNPDAEVTWLCGRDEARVRANLAKYELHLPDARVTTRFEDLLAAPDVDIIDIATPNHLHAAEAIAAAEAGKHFLLEKPTGLDEAELIGIRDAVRRAGVRTIVSFELRYNPFLRFARWLQASGRLGEIRFARAQYLSRVTDWYPGWEWVRTKASGRSHLLAAGCHAVDALRWCGGREPIEVSAFHTHFTAGYEWPTSIVVNMSARGPGARTCDELDRLHAALHLPAGVDGGPCDASTGSAPVAGYASRSARNSRPRIRMTDVRLEAATDPSGHPAIRIRCEMPGSADVTHHPFQAEIDELVACVLAGRETSINVFEAQKTMEVCLAADRSADNGGRPVALPLLAD